MTFILLFLLRSQDYSLDSLHYANQIESGTDMYHPHHLLFSPSVRLLLLFLQLFAANATAILAAQLFNGLAGAFSVWLLFKILIKLGANLRQAALLSIAFLFSYGIWKFSSMVEVYLPSLVFLEALFLLIISAESRVLSLPKMFLGGAFLAFSVLFHQSNILICIPLVFLGWSMGGRKNLLPMAGLLFTGGLLTLSFYLFGMSQSGYGISLEAFREFSLKYELQNAQWGTFANFSPKGINQVFQSQTATVFLPRLGKLAVFELLTAGWIGFVSISGWMKSRRANSAEKAVIRSLLLFLAIYYLFFLWWLPGELEFFIVTLFPLFLLTYFAIQSTLLKRKQIKSWIFLGLGLMIPLLNGSYYLSSSINESDAARKAREIIQWSPCTPITEVYVAEHVKHFHDRPAWSVNDFREYAYTGFFTREDLPLQPASCFFLSTQYLDPNFSWQSRSGAQDPGGWWKLISVLFDLQPDLDSTFIARSVSIEQKQAETIAFFHGSYWRFKNPISFLLRADSLLVQHGTPLHLTDFYRKHESTIPLPSW